MEWQAHAILDHGMASTRNTGGWTMQWKHIPVLAWTMQWQALVHAKHRCTEHAMALC
jgi:hypothetical protein